MATAHSLRHRHRQYVRPGCFGVSSDFRGVKHHEFFPRGLCHGGGCAVLQLQYHLGAACDRGSPFNVNHLYWLGAFGRTLGCATFAQDGSHSWLLSTIALGIIVENLTMLTFGKEVRGYPSPLAEVPITILGFGVFPLELVIPVVGLATAIALRVVSTKTLVGKAFQAVSDNPDTARLMGVPVAQLIAASFALSTILAGLAGMLIAPIANVSATMGTLLGLKAFATAIIGGLSNPWGVMVAGVVYGVIESVAAGYLAAATERLSGLPL